MSTHPYEILEHPADIGLKIYGRTLPELFANAASGLMSLATRIEESSPDEAHHEAPACITITAQGFDLEDLLVNWLSEILYLIDCGRWLFNDFSVEQITATSIEGHAIGWRSDLTCRVVPVKAVTYHQIAVRQTADGWKAVVYFDI